MIGRNNSSQKKAKIDVLPHSRGHFASGLVLILVLITSISFAFAVAIMRIGFTPVLTNSMEPSVDPGSVVITKQKSTSDLSLGDRVILPLPGGDGQRYLHRIVEIRHYGTRIHIKTKGDKNSLPDPWTLEVTSKDVPIVIASIPYVGWTTNILRPTYLRLALASVIIILVIVALMRIRRQSKDQGLRISEAPPPTSGV